MTFRIAYTKRAQRDLEKATRWIEERALETAERWLRGFIDRLATLQENALVHPFAPENHQVDAEIRQIIYRTKSRRSNRALFTVQDNTVLILCIRRPGQRTLSGTETRKILD